MTEVLHYVERSTPPKGDSPEDAIFAKEMAAAKMERMGYSVGFRLCERLSQNRVFSSGGKDSASIAAAAQLEAVKFLCKEVWIEVFRKQIDKLQTNGFGASVGMSVGMSVSIGLDMGLAHKPYPRSTRGIPQPSPGTNA